MSLLLRLKLIPQLKEQTAAPDARPPAKITRPEASDAAAKKLRACPRHVALLVQLLLEAL